MITVRSSTARTEPHASRAVGTETYPAHEPPPDSRRAEPRIAAPAFGSLEVLAPMPDDALLVGEEPYWHELDVTTEQVLENAVQLAEAAGVPDPTGWAAAVGALQGRWADPNELGYDLAYDHLAVVADTQSVLEGLAERAERELLQVPLPGGGVWGWLGGHEPISDSELDGLVLWQRGQQGRVAFGEPASGMAGFAESHWQAREAATIAQALGQPAVRFADVLLPIALRRDPDLARSFVDRELGALGRPGERMGQLRSTVCAYLEHGQSVSAAAAALGCDRKTIQRRLHAAEQLLCRYVDDRSGELLVALRTINLLSPRDPAPSPARN